MHTIVCSLLAEPLLSSPLSAGFRCANRWLAGGWRLLAADDGQVFSLEHLPYVLWQDALLLKLHPAIFDAIIQVKSLQAPGCIDGAHSATPPSVSGSRCCLVVVFCLRSCLHLAARLTDDVGVAWLCRWWTAAAWDSCQPASAPTSPSSSECSAAFWKSSARPPSASPMTSACAAGLVAGGSTRSASRR